jgi:hypothetical protein
MLPMLLGLLLGQDAVAFYNPSTGKWLSRDPINELGSKIVSRDRRHFDRNEEKNVHGFVRNNPLMYYDPLGKDLTGIIVGGVFPESWAISGDPAGTNAGWYAVHCAIHCWLSTLRTQMGYSDVANAALSGLHTVAWEIFEHINSGDYENGDPGWGYEPWYDRLTDAYANTYGATKAAKGCAPRCYSAWYGSIARVIRDANKARRCCDSACATAQPQFEGLATALRVVGETSEEVWDILEDVYDDLTD